MLNQETICKFQCDCGYTWSERIELYALHKPPCRCGSLYYKWLNYKD